MPQAKAIPEISAETTLLFEKIVSMQVGDVLEYAALSDLIGRDVQRSARGNLRTARRKAVVEKSIVTECVWNLGIKRLDDAGITKIGESTIRTIRRRAKEGARKLSCADPSNLDSIDRAKHGAYLTMTAMVHEVTGKRAAKAIEAEVEKVSGELPGAKALRALVEREKRKGNSKE